MTNDELRAFKTLFSKYCRTEMENGYCNGEECEWCPINKAYEEVERFENSTAMSMSISMTLSGTQTEKQSTCRPKLTTHSTGITTSQTKT